MANETLNPQIEESWKKALAEEFGAEYMKELKKKLVEEMKVGVGGGKGRKKAAV